MTGQEMTGQEMTGRGVVEELVRVGTPLMEGRMAVLRERLVTDADRDGLLDVAYRTVDSPVGLLLLAATSVGLVRVAFDRQGHADALEGLAREISPRILRAPKRLDGVARQLDEYFTGRRHRFDVALDLRLAHGFRRAVLEQLPNIAYGTTVTYAAVATAAGSPQAVRAVGSACARNPVPLVVPCHRVVRSDGTLGGYAGGPAAKRTLLGLEAA
jgi:methylated-DNA-[protein]-cysteine S-methyltransferase